MSGLICTLLLAMQMSLIYAQYPHVLLKCRLLDSSCLTRQVQLLVPAVTAGARQLGSESIDPMRIDHGRLSVAGLTMDYNNAVFRGLGQSVIDSASVNSDLNQIHLVYHTNLTMDSLYTFGGSFFGLPFGGDGDLNIDGKNLQIEAIMPFEIIQDPYGRNVMNLKAFTYKVDFKGDVKYYFSNLYNGNKQLSDWVLTFINANWKVLSDTFNKPILDIVTGRVFKTVRSYLLSIPVDQLLAL